MKCIKKKKSYYLFLIVFFYSALTVQSQVMIGSTKSPLKGTLLDLKEFDEEVEGGANSYGGLVLPRVILTDINSLSPILTGSEPDYVSLKPRYTGTVVYNVSTNASLEKGMYVWDGSKWNLLNHASAVTGVYAENGLKLENGVIKLGDKLIENTEINIGNYNLLFENGKIGIGSDGQTPPATVYIENANSLDPLLLGKLPLVSDPKNAIEVKTSPDYFPLRISDGGVVRKAPKEVQQSSSYVNLLSANTAIPTTTTEVDLKWTGSPSVRDHIELPETGVYVFSFNFYGTIASSTIAAKSFNLSAYKEAVLVRRTEFVLIQANSTNASYCINMVVSGNAGDKIYFKLGGKSSGGIAWTLSAGNNTNMSKTSMAYWKI